MSRAEAHALEIPSDPIPGVNLVGFLEGESGLGEAARMVARTLEHAGIPFAAISYAQEPNRNEHVHSWPLSNAAPYDTNLICIQPDELPMFAASLGRAFFAKRTSIALWFWESTVFPDEYGRALRLLDRVWVMSEHVRRVVAAATSAPVGVLPVPVEQRRRPEASRDALGLPDGFLFMALFDFVSGERKNPHAVVDAFRRAFDATDGAKLVLKTINGRERKPKLLGRLEDAVADRDDIAIMDGYVSSSERDALIAACDCFVSLHRSEGLGLPILEAMSFGKPVIATAYSGNMDFMEDESSYLVPFRLVAVPENERVHAPSAEWAEPDVASASSLMRRVFDNPAEARAMGDAARRTLLSRFSLERSAAFVRAELEAARADWSPHGRSRRRGAILEASLALDADWTRAPDLSWRPVALLRRVLLRALWPQFAASHRRDAALLDVLTDVEHSLARIETTLADAAPGSPGYETTRAPVGQLRAKRVGASSSSSEPL